MRVAITGASGLIGTALTRALVARGDEVVRLVRRQGAAPTPGVEDRRYDPRARWIDRPGLADVDAVVTLAGVPIATRWSAQQKVDILQSRLDSTRTVVVALSAGGRCRRFLAGSAIGVYGPTGIRAVDESSPAGGGFLADVVVAWEAAAAESPVAPAYLRTGHVMAREGGYLGKQVLLFQLGIGGVMGDGSQVTSWITLADHVRATLFLLDRDDTGPVNLTAPSPVTNRRFTAALGAALHRPTVIPVPIPALRLLFGSDMVDEAILSSQTVLPRRLLDAGFTFGDTAIEPALKRVFA